MPPEPFSQSHLADLRPGTRVVLRVRLPEDEVPPGGPKFTDVVGEVAHIADGMFAIRTRRGEVQVAADRVVAAKALPPAPARRGRPHRAIGIADLERVMARGMPPLDDAHVGQWWLRWADGYTGRANSTLPLGDPGMPMDVAVSRVRDWYAERDAFALMQLYGPAGFDPADDPLGASLVAAGWEFFQHTLVMTADAGAVAVDPVADVEVSVTNQPDADWWAGASPRALTHRDTLSSMLRLVPAGGYLTSYLHGGVVGHARTVHSAGWCGIFDVHTDPGVRRRGVARTLMAACARDALAHGSRLLYLQVSADNAPAVALYRSLGFEVHHDYYYARSAPPRSAKP